MVVHLQRVSLDVIEARLGDFRVQDQLPVTDGHGTLQAEVRAVHGFDLRFLRLSVQQRHEALELDLLGALGLADVDRCGHHVLQIDRSGNLFAALDTGPGRDEWHARAVLVQILFTEQAVMPHA